MEPLDDRSGPHDPQPADPQPADPMPPEALEPAPEFGPGDGGSAFAAQEPPAPPPANVAGWQGVGSVIGRSLDIFGSAFALFLILAVPAAAFGALTVAAGRNVPALILAALLAALTGVISGAAMMLAADDLGRGARPGLADVLDRAAGRAIPLVAATVVFGAAFGAVIVVAIVIAVILGVLLTAAGSAVLGGILIIVTVVIATVAVIAIGMRWALVGQAVVIGGAGPIAGLRQSWALTRGRLRSLVGLYFGLVVLTFLASVGESLLSTYAPNRAFAAVGLAGAAILTTPLLAISFAVAYRDLTGRPAGLDQAPPRGSGRRTAAVAVLGGGLVVFAAGIWAVSSAGGQIFLPERGQVIAGTSQNPLDLCHPNGVKSTFAANETIWIAAIFSTHVPEGDDVVVTYARDGLRLGSASLTADAKGLDCYYEIEPVAGANPGTYEIKVTHGSAVIADGTFTVK
jgi:hypothetical protein